MSSFVPRLAVVLVPCTLVACADRMRAAQYAPRWHNESANSGYVPRETESPVVPKVTSRIEAKSSQTIITNSKAAQPSTVAHTQVEKSPSQNSPQDILVTHDPSAPAVHASEVNEEYIEPPVKPIAFRPGIVTRSGHQPLLWEKQKAESVMWSTYAMQVIGDEAANSLLPGTEDIAEFCPRYNDLERELRINFWAYLISAIAQYESSFNPADRLTEKQLGVDKVTNKTVVSEGLLQLSYQDSKYYQGCDFDWEADRDLNEKDLQKSILDPFKNLRCGITILAHQVRTQHKISVDGYWSVLRPDGRKYSKINQIKRLTNKLSFCGSV